MSATAEILQLEGRRYFRLSELAHVYRIHPATLTRHLVKGVVDSRTGETIRPEGAIKTPGRWLIPAGSYERFLERVTASRQGIATPSAPSASLARERELARVDRELAHAGI